MRKINIGVNVDCIVLYIFYSSKLVLSIRKFYNLDVDKKGRIAG